MRRGTAHGEGCEHVRDCSAPGATLFFINQGGLIPILQTNRPREAKGWAQGHTASWDRLPQDSRLRLASPAHCSHLVMPFLT